MRCRLCGARAGLRMRCGACRILWDVWQEHRGEGMRRLLDAFIASGAKDADIERFLDAEPRSGEGTIRDHIAADMANQLLDALGQGPTQDPRKTKKLREAGQWRTYDQPPED